MVLLNRRDDGTRGDDNAVRAATRLARLTKHAVCLIAALLPAGCSPNESDPQQAARPAVPGLEVSVAVPAGLGLQEDWQIAVSEWEAASGARCTIEEVENLQESSLPPGSAGLAVVPLSNLPALIDAGWAAPIEPESPAGPWVDEVFTGLARSLADAEGNAWGIPLSSPVLACYYRADLLERAGLSPPSTWDEYRGLVETLPEWAPGLSASEPWGEGFRASLFLARAAPAALHPDNYSLYLDVEEGTPLIGDPPFEAALQESLEILGLIDPRARSLGPADCVDDVFAGRSALAIGSPGIAARGAGGSFGEPGRADDIRVGVAPLPGAVRVYRRQTGQWSAPPGGAAVHRVTLVGFDGWMVCAAARLDPSARSAAWQLWTTLESPDFEGTARPWSRAPVRTSQLAAVLQHPAPGFRTEEWQAHVQAEADSLHAVRTVLDLPLPERERFRSILTRRISAAMEGEETAAQALDGVRDEWEKLVDELGRERIVNVYRACSGLSPLSE